MKLTDEQVNKLLSDVSVFKLLLRAWIDQWDTFEEFISDDLMYESGEMLYERTKKELGIKPIESETK